MIEKFSKLSDEQKTQLGFVVVVVIGLIPRLTVLLGSIELIIRYVPDDAFYYFQTSKNIVAGAGSTLDGLHLTNGYHPLWMITLLPLARIFSDPVVLVKAALTVTVGLNLASTWVIFRLLIRIIGYSWLAIVGAAVTYINVQGIQTSLNGLETSLATFMFVFSLMLVYERAAFPKISDQLYFVFLGIVLGLLFLARTDTVFYIAVLILYTIREQFKDLWTKVILPISLLLLAAFLTVLPWFIWNLTTFGSIFQTSANAVPHILRENFLANGGDARGIIGNGAIYLLVFLFFELGLYQGFGWIIYQATLLFCFWIFFENRKGKITFVKFDTSWLQLLSWLWVSGLLLIFVHTALRWYPRPWYFDQLIYLSMLTGISAFAIALKKPKTSQKLTIHKWSESTRKHLNRITRIGGVLVSLIIAFFIVKESFVAPYDHQIEMLDAAAWVRQNTPEDAIAAAFNSGIIGFFSERTIINLDGVMNNAAYGAILDRELFEFFVHSGADYFLDYDPGMRDFYELFLGPVEWENAFDLVGVIDHPNVSFRDDPIKIYKLK